MEQVIPIPTTIDTKKSKNDDATIVIEPCYPGYGITLGNALRRVLLSSMPGAAIVSCKIKGAQHEFTSIQGIKEDVVEIMLNLKQVRLKVFSDTPVEVTLHAKGEGQVTAKDIKATSDVEIVNIDQPIATITEKNTELEMTLTVQKGRGYEPAEMQQKNPKDLGTIILDAMYSPIKNVNFDVEHVRVGEITNFDKLILHITTDGSVSPEEAFRTASEILVRHFSSFTQNTEQEQPKKKSKKSQEPKE